MAKAKRPNDMLMAVWSQFKDADNVEGILDVWAGTSQEDKAYINANPNEALDLLDDDADASEVAAAVVTDTSGQTVGQQVASIVEALNADKAFTEAMADGVAKAVEAKYRVLDFMGHIERMQKAGKLPVLPRWEPDVVADTSGGNVMHDAYTIPGRKGRNGRQTKAKVGHRLWVIYDQWVGAASAKELERLTGLSADEKKADDYKANRADHRLPLGIGRKYWVDAATATHAIADINQLPGIRVVPMLAKDGKTILRSAYPFQLQELERDDKGNVTNIKRSIRISLGDIVKYRCDVAQDLIGTKDDDGVEYVSMFDALLDSKETTKRTLRQRLDDARNEFNAVIEEMRKQGADVDGLVLSVRNAKQAESVLADIAAYAGDRTFRTDLHKLVSSDDHALRTANTVRVMLDTIITQELKLKAQALDDAEIAAGKAAAA